jgi:hypothetical protein
MILMEEGGIVVGSKETGKEGQRLEIVTKVEYFHERIRKCYLPVMVVRSVSLVCVYSVDG